MKRIILLMILVYSVFMVNAQTITINSIGMQKDGDPGNFSVEAGDVVKVSVNYTTDTMMSVQGVNFNNILDKVMLYGFSGATPAGGPNYGEQLDITNFISGDTGTNVTATFNFTVPSISSSDSFQLTFGLTGINGSDFFSTVHGSPYSSYVSVGPFTAAASTASGNYQSYMEISTDNTTDAPNLYTPDSPTVATYDNKTLLIDFKLNEAPLAGSVKLYFSPNSDGSSPSTTLTLASAYENTTRHQITLDASALTTASSHISAVSGNTSLTHLNTYYVAVGYKDALDNAEATSPWNKLIYDNAAIQPTLVSGSNQTSSSMFNVNFTLGEPSQTGGITIYIKDINTTDTATIVMSGAYESGSNIISLDGTDLSNHAGISSAFGIGSLESGNSYRFTIEMTDLAGNINISSDSPIFQYFNHNIGITATTGTIDNDCALLGHNSAAYQPLGHVGLTTSSGVATLSSMKFTVGGTIDPNDATNLALYESNSNSFNAGTQISNLLTFTGIGDYTFTIADRTINTTGKYYFVAISLGPDNNLIYTDNITLSTQDSFITTSGTMNTFTAPNFSQKCLFRAVVVDYFSGFPNIAPGTADTPFLRIDLRTNKGESSISGLKVTLSGDLTSNDVINEGFKVWESASETFNPSNPGTERIWGTANFNQELSFSGLARAITATPKYYFFTVTTTSTANTEAIFGGDIIDATDITVPQGIFVKADLDLDGFPLTGEQHTLPVELSSFTALTIDNNNVKIEWTVETETGLSGYYLLRGNTINMANAEQIPVLIPSLNSSQSYTYSFVDREVENNNVYYYWLKTVELSNESEFFGPAQVTVGNPFNDTPEVILGTKLYTNYPNPFNPSTTISFSLASPQNVNIEIYNIRGQLVKVLHDGFVGDVNTKHQLVWHGDDANNNKVASGIYYSKMTAGKHRLSLIHI